jgi:hypothetical protein
MMLGDGMFAYLSSELSVGDRVYPLTLRQGAVLPAVTYQLVGGEGPLHSHEDAHDGDGSPRPTFQRSRVQLGCWAESARAADVLAAEVAAAVDGFTGSWGDVTIASALVDISIDDWRPDVAVYRRVIDVLVQWTGAAMCPEVRSVPGPPGVGSPAHAPGHEGARPVTHGDHGCGARLAANPRSRQERAVRRARGPSPRRAP